MNKINWSHTMVFLAAGFFIYIFIYMSTGEHGLSSAAGYAVYMLLSILNEIKEAIQVNTLAVITQRTLTEKKKEKTEEKSD